MKKSPVGSWRSFFNLGKSSSVSKRKLQRNESEPSEMKAMALKGQCVTPSLLSALWEQFACRATLPSLSCGSSLTQTQTHHIVITGFNRIRPSCVVTRELSSFTSVLSPNTYYI